MFRTLSLCLFSRCLLPFLLILSPLSPLINLFKQIHRPRSEKSKVSFFPAIAKSHHDLQRLGTSPPTLQSLGAVTAIRVRYQKTQKLSTYISACPLLLPCRQGQSRTKRCLKLPALTLTSHRLPALFQTPKLELSKNSHVRGLGYDIIATLSALRCAAVLHGNV